MASFVLSTFDNVGRSLSSGETGLITRNGTLAETVVMGSNSPQRATLIVHGDIVTSSIGVWVDVGNGDTSIMVSAGGSISGYVGIRNETQLNDMVISNAGVIEGYLTAAILSRLGAAATIVNSGTIQTAATGVDAFYGFQHAAINVQGSLLDLNNTGTIAGASHGIVTGVNTFALISNTGTISAGVALDLGDDLDIVENAGLIRGVVRMGGWQDAFDGRLGRQTGIVYGEAGDDTLRGGTYEDRFDGGIGDDLVFGGAGEDTLVGDDGNDTLRGGSDDDFLRTGAGIDNLTGGAGDDTLTGGTEADTFVFARGQGTDRITDFVNGVDRLDLRLFDYASFAALQAVCSNSSLGLRMDVAGEGMIFVAGLTLATLTAGDVLL